MKVSDYIKVDLFGQNNNDTSHIYTFPDKVTNQYSFSEKTQWVAPIMDPRGIYQSVCTTGASCYVLMRHKNGMYYSLIERNQEDARGGLLMLTVFIAKGHSGDGSTILDTIKRLRSILIVNKEYFDSSVESCVENIVDRPGYKVFPERIISQNNTGGAAQASVAYRTFNTNDELAELFSFTFQCEYENFDKLVFVNSNDLRDGITLPRITEPIVKHYNIVNAADAVASSSFVADNELFTIYFTKENCCKQKVELTVKDHHIKYYSIVGNEVKLKSAAEAGVSFNKKFEFRARTKGSFDLNLDIKDVSITVNGRVISSDAQGRKYLDMKESEIESCPSVLIHATYRHHEELSEQYDVSTFRNGKTIDLTFSPKMRTENISFCFDSILTEPTVIKFSETDKNLDRLYTGKFCGYRVVPKGNGMFEVRIPDNHNPHLYDEIDGCRSRKRRLPKWAMILIITVSALLLTGGSFVGGFMFEKYYESNQKEQTSVEPGPVLQQTPTIQIEDSTMQNEE